MAGRRPRRNAYPVVISRPRNGLKQNTYFGEFQMLMNHRELGQMYRTLGGRETCRLVTECLELGRRGQVGGLRPSDFSIRDLAESVVDNGREWVQSMDPRRGQSVLESGSAIDSTAFSNITGQLLINEIMDGYQSEEFVFSNLFRTTSTRLNGEKIPGIAKLGDQTEEVHEGMPYPHVGTGEDYIETPSTTKRGLIVPVTKEAVFFDRTGLVLERAREVGESLGIDKEKRCVDVAIGAINNYKWRGTAYNTYQTATPWINELSGSSYDLEDWTDVDAAEQLFANMVDPNTGEPILIGATTAIVSPARRHAANRILNATEVRYTGSGAPTETLAVNPLSGAGYSARMSRYFYSRLQSQLALTADQAKATWLFGDFARAFRYMENWPITTVQAPANSEAEFNQDIVARFKASERGVAAVHNPRYVARVKGF